MKIKSFLLIAILVTVSFYSSGLVSVRAVDNSALIAQLQAQIQALMQQLAQLQAQQGTTPTWCHNFNTSLGYANSGTEEVIALHTALEKENISYSPDDNSSYTEATGAAVVQFQAKYGVRQTGYVGPLTRAKLNSLYGCTAPQLTPGFAPTTAPVLIPAPTVTFTASNESGQTFNTDTISVPVGSTVNFTYLSTNATTCSTYANSALLNSNTNGFTQGATSGSFGSQPRFAGTTNTFTVTCSNASGIQASKSIALTTPYLPVPTVTFTASNENGQTFNTDTISLPLGSTVNLAYSSTNAAGCYVYINSVLANNTDSGLTQGATSGNFGSQPRFAGTTNTFTVTCSNATGQQASKTITVNTTNY